MRYHSRPECVPALANVDSAEPTVLLATNPFQTPHGNRTYRVGDASRLPIYTARPQACVKAKIRLTHGLSSSVSLKRRGTACWGGVAKRDPWHFAKRVEQ